MANPNSTGPNSTVLLGMSSLYSNEELCFGSIGYCFFFFFFFSSLFFFNTFSFSGHLSFFIFHIFILHSHILLSATKLGETDIYKNWSIYS